jgi:hypothetical protein
VAPGHQSNIFNFAAEQGFHESITPSLKQDVEHVTPWTDLPCFECAPSTSCQFTDDSLVMHDLCSDILEQVANMPLSLYVIGVGVQLSAPATTTCSTTDELSVRAIQILTQDQNLIFQVWHLSLLESKVYLLYSRCPISLFGHTFQHHCEQF